MVFIETSAFTRWITSYMSDDEYLGLQKFLLERPGAGNIIRGSGGIRKLRWRLAGQGKRGGVRIIYYWKVSDDQIYLLTIYGKNEKESIPAHILKKISEEIRNV